MMILYLLSMVLPGRFWVAISPNLRDLGAQLDVLARRDGVDS